jgi:hypothetical protein
MCTDVDRNDKSRICEPGSVRVLGRRQIEMYSRSARGHDTPRAGHKRHRLRCPESPPLRSCWFALTALRGHQSYCDDRYILSVDVRFWCGRLIHTVDHVEGYLRKGFDALDAFLCHTWAVTVTGAPKTWAIQVRVGQGAS